MNENYVEPIGDRQNNIINNYSIQNKVVINMVDREDNYP